MSRGLRDDPVIPEATRRRIQAAAREVGYAPNPLVSSIFGAMRRELTPGVGTLAFLTAHETRDGWSKIDTFRDFFEGARERALEQGFTLETHWAAEPGLSGERLSEILDTRGVRGLILSTRRGATAFPRLHWDRFSCVRIGVSQGALPLHCTVNHQFQTVRLVAGQMVDRGYRRIGFAMERGQNEATGLNWAGGYLAWQTTRPKAERIPLSLPPVLNQANFVRWFRRLRPDAVIAINSQVRDWIEGMGLKVPGDVGLAMLDWHERHGDLAGADQNNRRVGAVAVDFVLGEIFRNERGIPRVPTTLLIDSTWHEGGSLAPRR